MMQDESGQTLYDAVGGEATFRDLVAGFYRRVAQDPVLRPLYPDADLAAAQQRLCAFLVQYWGGPDTYSRERGHPRLRRRHAPFAIGAAERDAWLSHMRAALDDVGLDRRYERAVWEHLHRAAFMLVNVADDPGP